MGEYCTGRKYRDDPTIFGWDLINEPRCNCFPSKLPPPSEWDSLEGACSPKCADDITVSPTCLFWISLIEDACRGMSGMLLVFCLELQCVSSVKHNTHKSHLSGIP